MLVDGTIAPTCDWDAKPDLYSGKAGYPGMNLQIAATCADDLAAVGDTPVHGARDDAHAHPASGLEIQGGRAASTVLSAFECGIMVAVHQ